MAVKLRLVRVGKKKQPTYRVVAADSRSPRNGRFIEIIGTYQPRRDPSVITLEGARAAHYLNHGAQPTEAVAKILAIQGVEKRDGTWVAPEPDAEPAAGPEAERADV